jgi:hypothetical protein
MKQWIDRPNTTKIKNFELMCAELSQFLNEFEMDQLIEFMEKISDSKWDINPSPEDCAGQIRLIIGAERYEIVKSKWALKNQHLIKEGRVKYIRLIDGAVFDGLDPEDHPNDYTKVYM